MAADLPPERGQLTCCASSDERSGTTRTGYHGTTAAAATSILASGFNRSTGGMLGPGVYWTDDIRKTGAYGDGTVLRVSVRCGKTKRIDVQGHALQTTWHTSAKYDTAWVPAGCGMVPSELSESCTYSPSRIRVTGISNDRGTSWVDVRGRQRLIACLSCGLCSCCRSTTSEHSPCCVLALAVGCAPMWCCIHVVQGCSHSCASLVAYCCGGCAVAVESCCGACGAIPYTHALLLLCGAAVQQFCLWSLFGGLGLWCGLGSGVLALVGAIGFDAAPDHSEEWRCRPGVLFRKKGYRGDFWVCFLMYVLCGTVATGYSAAYCPATTVTEAGLWGDLWNRWDQFQPMGTTCGDAASYAGISLCWLLFALCFALAELGRMWGRMCGRMCGEVNVYSVV